MKGLVRDLNPGHLALKARIIPLDQRALYMNHIQFNINHVFSINKRNISKDLFILLFFLQTRFLLLYKFNLYKLVIDLVDKRIKKFVFFSP